MGAQRCPSLWWFGTKGQNGTARMELITLQIFTFDAIFYIKTAHQSLSEGPLLPRKNSFLLCSHGVFHVVHLHSVPQWSGLIYSFSEPELNCQKTAGTIIVWTNLKTSPLLTIFEKMKVIVVWVCPIHSPYLQLPNKIHRGNLVSHLPPSPLSLWFSLQIGHSSGEPRFQILQSIPFFKR